MKKLFLSLLAALAIVPSLFAQGDTTMVFTLTNNAPQALLTTSRLISEVTAINNSTNIAIIRFYDSSAGATNYIQAAYTNFVSYTTNFDVVFTNQTGVLVTNTFSGLFTGPTSVAAVTNTRPVFYTLGLPPSGAADKNVRLLPIRGLTALSTADAVVTITYDSH